VRRGAGHVMGRGAFPEQSQQVNIRGFPQEFAKTKLTRKLTVNFESKHGIAPPRLGLRAHSFGGETKA
ncbi:MAG TPA: hypothetical protein VJ063_07455, partial [Verrucomicrobiae bacterium]|nr:hypothetical protein [Verrucomicrobiae bacterium]